MYAEIFTALYQHNAWANRRVWDCIMQLSDDQFDQDIPHSIGSIHNQIVHIMGVEFWWFKFLTTGKIIFVTEADCANRAAIRARWDEAEATIRDYVSKLTPAELAREVKPDFWDAEKPSLKVYEALFQVANHSLDHRAQTLAALNSIGGPTTPQDYIFYKFDTAGVPWTND